VHLDEMTHDSESESEAAEITRGAAVGLPESIEDVGQEPRLDARAGIADGYFDLLSDSGQEASTRPRGLVNLMAFESMFKITCCKRLASPNTWLPRSSMTTFRSICFASILGRITSMAAWKTCAISTRRASSLSLPAMMRDASRMSSISRCCDFELRSMTSSAWRF
jgi:hypothetical protein